MEQKQYDVLCGFMDHLTKGYNWYYDTPEQRFKHTPESIWLINPDTKEWALELEKGGKLWWNWGFHLNFRRYFNMERPDFESFIKVWMEDVLNRGVASTVRLDGDALHEMEDVLNRGVASTGHFGKPHLPWMEDVLNRGVASTSGWTEFRSNWMEDVLNRGVASTSGWTEFRSNWMEDVLNRGITTNGKSRWKLWEWMKNVLNIKKTLQ